jgi:hypothetical protein
MFRIFETQYKYVMFRIYETYAMLNIRNVCDVILRFEYSKHNIAPHHNITHRSERISLLHR